MTQDPYANPAYPNGQCPSCGYGVMLLDTGASTCTNPHCSLAQQNWYWYTGTTVPLTFTYTNSTATTYTGYTTTWQWKDEVELSPMAYEDPITDEENMVMVEAEAMMAEAEFIPPPKPKPGKRKLRARKRLRPTGVDTSTARPIVSAIRRLFWLNEELDKVPYNQKDDEDEAVKPDPGPARIVPEESANLVGSLTETGQHAPVLDIDFEAQLIPSSTPGHYHLLLDKEMDAESYRKLLLVLAEVGILEPNYVEFSLKRGATMVRRPGILKPGAIDIDQLQKDLADRTAQLATSRNELMTAGRTIEDLKQQIKDLQTVERGLTWQ